MPKATPFHNGVFQGVLRFSVCLAIIASPATGAASVPQTASFSHPTAITEREHRVWKTPYRASEFRDVPHVSVKARCEDTKPPQALTTPDPLPLFFGPPQKVKVSFIVGTDGRVHSPLILQSGGPLGDRDVLRTVRTWRYRPATCNGVPTEAEGKIEFSRR